MDGGNQICRDEKESGETTPNHHWITPQGDGEVFQSKKTELLCLEHLSTGDVGKLGCEVGGSTNYLPRRFNYAHPTTSPTATISPVPAVVATQVKFKLASFYKAMGRKKNAPTQ